MNYLTDIIIGGLIGIIILDRIRIKSLTDSVKARGEIIERYIDTTGEAIEMAIKWKKLYENGSE